MEQARTAQASADLETLRNEFEDQKTEAIKKYETDLQSAWDATSQLQQDLQDERQRTAAVQQQFDDLRTQATAQIGEWKRKYQEIIEQAGLEASQVQNSLANRETLLQQAHDSLAERDEQARQARGRYAEALSQAHNETRIAREKRDRALARANALETSRPDADMEDASRPDPAQENRNEASAEIAGLLGQLSAKEKKNRDQAKRILELDAQLARSGGNASSPQQQAASIPSPPEEKTASGIVSPQMGQSPCPDTPTRGATNHLSKARQDALPKSRSGDARSAGISKNVRGAKTRGIGQRRPGSAPSGRAEVSKEHKSVMLDSHLKNGSASKVFNQTKREKDPVDLYENEFHGKGFDSFEASKIVVDYTFEFDVSSPSQDELGQQLWAEDGEVQYYADRGQQRQPICIEIDADYFIFEENNEEDEVQKEYILPLSKDLSELDEKQKHQYAQACIIAKLPETQTEAARASLSSAELQAFEQRMFKGPKPIGQCHEELEYPKMFKKIVRYLRSNWRFRDAAKRWAAGEDALFNAVPSCWPPMFANLESSITTIFKSEEGYEKDIEKPYKSDCTTSDKEMSKLGNSLSVWNKPTTVANIVDGAGKVTLDKGKKTQLPNEGLRDMFGPPK